jgi:pimeloyl-ACP methyl ester carboxylesterase
LRYGILSHGIGWRLFASCLSLVLPAVAVSGAPVTPSAGVLRPPQDFAFMAEIDGSTQHYVQMLPTNATGDAHDVLIALHGHGSDRWQCVNDGRGEFKAARDFAAAHGMTYLSPDYRASTSWMGPAAEADVIQLIGLLRQQHPSSRIFLTGASMGGTSVLIFACLHPDLVAGVCSQNGTANMVEYPNFADAIAASYGGDKTEKAQEYEKRSPESVPATFTMPVAFAVGGKDSTVPPDSVRRLAAKLIARNGKTVLLIDRKDGGHATSYEDTMASLEFVLHAADAK